MNTAKKIPRHIAIIMDGNGRWAQQRSLPRVAGHKAGIEAARKIISTCAEQKIEVLTLFAFSSENWRRPLNEVNELMQLFLLVLQREVKKLHKNNIQMRVIGDCTKFSNELQNWIQTAQELTQTNTGLKLVIAANYGGRWDITQSIQAMVNDIQNKQLSSQISPEVVNHYLTTQELPEPDLFIRTGGEFRLSNFLIWQLAYTELYFTDIFWPDFDEKEFHEALNFFATRERRFGTITPQ